MGLPEEKIRIAHVVGNLETGGTQSLIIEIMRRVDRSKYDPVLVYLKEPNHFAAEIEEKGWECRRVSVSRNFKLSQLKALAAAFIADRIDVVHCHSDHANIVGRLAAIMAGIPTILVHYHNTYEHRLNNAFKAMETLLAPRTSAYIACSEGVKQFLEANLDIGNTPLLLLRNGLDLNPFLAAGKQRTETREALGIPPEIFHVVHTARLEPHKRPHVILEAFAKIFDMFPEQAHEWQLTYVGGGSLMQPLQEKITELDQQLTTKGKPSLSPRVRMVGWTREISRWLSTADVFVLLSSNEGLPLSLVEAMACGVPGIATDVVGPREVIEHGKNGSLLPLTDHAPVVDELLRYKTDPTYRNSIANNAISRAFEFSIDRYIAELENIYTKTASNRRAGTRSPSLWWLHAPLLWRAFRLARKMRRQRNLHK